MELAQTTTTSKALKPLIMAANPEERIKFEMISTDFLEAENVKPCFTTYDAFQEESRENRFDCVVALLLNEEVTADDVEMMEEYYQHYAKVPVFVWISYKVGEGLSELKKYLKQFKKYVINPLTRAL